MRPIPRFEAMIGSDRHEALTAVADALGMAGGWIVDHALFSDMMATITFAVPGDRMADLGEALAAAGLRVTPDPAKWRRPDGAEVIGQLTLTFTQGTGGLRQAVPAFS